MTQSGIEHISDVIMISDAGSFDMGFLTTINEPVGTASTPACPPSITPNPWTNTVYTSGPRLADSGAVRTKAESSASTTRPRADRRFTLPPTGPRSGPT